MPRRDASECGRERRLITRTATWADIAGQTRMFRMVLNQVASFHGLRLAVAAMVVAQSLTAFAQDASVAKSPPVVQKITASNTKVEMTVNGSRILTMDEAIPRAQVANPDLLDFTVLSENQVQIHAKKAGLTTIN